MNWYGPRHAIGGYVLGTGMLFSLGFAPFYLWPLSLVCLALLFEWLWRATSWRQALWVGWLFGFGHQLTSLYWLPRAFYIDGGESLMGLLAGVPALLGLAAVQALYIALPIVIVAALPWRRWRMGPWAVALLLALVWVGFEFLRSLPPFGFPWNLAGYMWAADPWLRQGAAWDSGVFGLSFVLLLAGFWLWRGPRYPLLGSVVLLVLVAQYGQLRLNHAPTEGQLAQQLPPLQLVQPNQGVLTEWDDEKRLAYLTHHLRLTNTTDDSAELVIWPETAVPYFLNEDAATRRMIAGALQPGQRLVTGAPFRQGQDVFNSIVVLDSQARLQDAVHKHILVPFGEYIPFPSVLPPLLNQLASWHRQSYSAGSATQRLAVGKGVSVLPLICYEAIFSPHVRKLADNQTFLLNISNDSWFDGTTALAQHAAMARMRTIETGLPLVRVANTGISKIYDRYGRILLAIPANVAVSKTFRSHSTN